MKLDLTNPGVSVYSVVSQPEPTATEPTKAEPTAPEQLEKAQNPLKKNQPAEMLTPQMIALMNDQTKRAVADAVGAIMEKFLPALEKLSAPSPKEKEEMEAIEKFRERSAREKKMGALQDEENRRNLKIQQKACRHLDGNERSSISLVHNFYDRLPRGLCMKCRAFLEPRHYELLPPSVKTPAEAEKFVRELVKQGQITGATPFVDPKTGITTHILVDEHPLYFRVREQEAQLGVVS